MEKKCAYCAEFACPLDGDREVENCIFNLIIYENYQKILFYNLSEKRIFKMAKKEGLKEINFQEAIREIDIIPEKEPNWKRKQILTLAKDLGIFG